MLITDPVATAPGTDPIQENDFLLLAGKASPTREPDVSLECANTTTPARLPRRGPRFVAALVFLLKR
jgi:hypothetical protein